MLATVLLAAIASGQVEVRYEDPQPRIPELPPMDRIKVAPSKRPDRDKPWRRWPVRR